MASDQARPKPVPVTDEISAPFWEAAENQRLVVQRCRSCGYYNHPPRRVCDKCVGQDLAFEQVCGRGKIYSFTVMHQRDVVGFENDAPFINIVVELEEQPMLLMVTNLPIEERERVKIDAPVEVCFEVRHSGITVPQFRIVNR